MNQSCDERWEECLRKGWHFDTLKTWRPDQVVHETNVLFEKIKPYLSGLASVLDFGCGKGRFCEFFIRHGFQYNGYEPCVKAREFCTATYGDRFTGILPEHQADLFYACTSMQYLDGQELESVLDCIREYRAFIIIESLGDNPDLQRYTALRDKFEIVNDSVFSSLEKYRLFVGVKC